MSWDTSANDKKTAKQRGSNADLLKSSADWISPNPDAGQFNYRTNPPPADGRKVILSDTDHLWGIGGDVAWVWKSFLRGLNPLFMDPYRQEVLKGGIDSKWEAVRRAMGVTRRLAERVNLAAMTPNDKLASHGYCLANPAKEYLVYLPAGGEASVDLAGAQIHAHLDHDPGDTPEAGLRRLQVWSNLASFQTFAATANVVGSAIWDDLRDLDERRAEVEGRPQPNTGAVEVYSPFSANSVVRAGRRHQLITATRRVGAMNLYHPRRTSNFNPQMDAWHRLGAAIISSEKQPLP